jgi:hypothetical protein
VLSSSRRAHARKRSKVTIPIVARRRGIINLARESRKYPAEDKHVLVNALLAAATSFFLTYLSDAIKRIPDPDNENALTADISMVFPRALYTYKFGC